MEHLITVHRHREEEKSHRPPDVTAGHQTNPRNTEVVDRPSGAPLQQIVLLLIYKALDPYNMLV